ncbi:MAG: type II toxin-antitoxin system VapC family toxin [Sphingomonadaceae bacterium]|nr:type II toxin-antitoxin system VapC family toxin [Sphingomonadaceae bacterium]
MKYLLDSNILIKLALGTGGEALRTRLASCDEGDLVTSAVALAEVAYGSMNAKPPPFEQLRTLTEEVPVLDFDYKAALAYAGLPFKRASFDRLIAAHALSNGLTVVTDNVKHFADVPALAVENWFAA